MEGRVLKDYTSTFRPLKKKSEGVRFTKDELYSIGFAMWRWDMWCSHDQGTYQDIHRKVEAGELTPGVCPRPGCECSWKHKEPS
jgi:hypothetical protein